ncbi:signal peptide, CUB and EGF-like domain-containing protein 3 isoform X1 [Branchiostoma floridae]|uniref:Signal peptide, CUB and EGF-like domain-containing protein 3 isoform X1 n=1 Tax=Branchiostoma floridae TaxID=7739 RepID=A0A9J7M864_BRAFL|nr:signal peptide, CUB and EGF-like domain-containing protein 3 isoform X1 [Branchiostoma floridae]
MYSTVVLCLLAVSGALAMPVTDSLVATVVMTTAVSRPCDPGYICFPNSTVPNPTDGIMGYICPVGHFCPTGALEEIPCPIGSYSNLIGLADASECVQCPAGYYCSLPGLQAPLGLCDPGYFCIPGSQSPTPVDGTCPEGCYCPTGSAAPIPCPVGTMNPVSHGSSVSECVLCPAGQYCSGAGLQTPTGHCSAGYFCIPGSQSPTPVDGTCPEGHYCPTGSAAPTPCPVGTMNPVSLGTGVSECVLCPAGQYCSGAGLQTLTGPCSAGYFCIPGSHSPTPIDGACPEGHYCPTGSAVPSPCPVGTMNPDSHGTNVLDCRPCQDE